MGLKIYSNFMASVSKDKCFTIRKAVVLETLEKGIKPTAFRLNMSKNTIRSWLGRFQSEGNDGLLDRRSGPNRIPHKTSLVLEKQIIAIIKTASCYGARRLKYFFNLTPSIGAIQRILNRLLEQLIFIYPHYPDYKFLQLNSDVDQISFFCSCTCHLKF